VDHAEVLVMPLRFLLDSRGINFGRDISQNYNSGGHKFQQNTFILELTAECSPECTGIQSLEYSLISILLIVLGFGAFPMVLPHCLCSLLKLFLREASHVSRSHHFLSVPASVSARCFARSSASAKPVIVVGPHLFT